MSTMTSSPGQRTVRIVVAAVALAALLGLIRLTLAAMAPDRTPDPRQFSRGLPDAPRIPDSGAIAGPMVVNPPGAHPGQLGRRWRRTGRR